MIEKVKLLLDTPIMIEGYYDDEKISENFTINQFINGGLVMKNDVAIQLEKLYDIYKHVNEVNDKGSLDCCDCNCQEKCVFK